jgi:hypothetical protein
MLLKRRLRMHHQPHKRHQKNHPPRKRHRKWLRKLHQQRHVVYPLHGKKDSNSERFIRRWKLQSPKRNQRRRWRSRPLLHLHPNVLA